MKKLILGTTLAALTTLPAMAETMRMSVTTSFANSGLSDVILPEIKKDTGIDLELLIVGTGQALELGANGDVDAVLVHSKPAEEKWLEGGHGTHRTEIMYNDFIFVGPNDDPAGVKDAQSAAEALQIIAEEKPDFVSRGDDSGTHKKEMSLWEQAGVNPVGDWYKSVGQGMGAALNTAAAMNAYIMTDRATWLFFENKADLDIAFENDPPLNNQYAYMPVNPDKGDHIKADLATQLEEWLMTDRAKELINGYKIDGQQLFFYNADQSAMEKAAE